MTLDGARGGLAWRLDNEGSGLYIELAPDTARVSLQRWGTTQREHSEVVRHDFDGLQTVQRRNPLGAGEALPFRLLSVGPYVEVSLAGEVAIATMSGKPRMGKWGFWVEDGSCVVRDLRWAAMRSPHEHSPTRSHLATEGTHRD